MMKSCFSLSRNASQNSQAEMFDSLIERPPDNQTQHLRKQLKTLKQANCHLTSDIVRLHQEVAGVRSTNLQFLSQMLKNIKASIEPTAKLQIHSNILMNEEDAAVYARYLVDIYTDLNDEAKQFDNYFKRMALKSKLYEEQINETCDILENQSCKIEQEMTTLHRDLQNMVASKEEKVQENVALNKKIEEIRRTLEAVNKQTEQENQKIDSVKTQIFTAEAKLEKVKSARLKLQELNILLNKTLSKQALIQNQSKTRSLQDELAKLKQMNTKTQIEIIQIRQSKKKQHKHFKTHI